MRSPRLALLSLAYAVSSYGTYLNLITLGLFAYHLTGSAMRTGLFLALRLGSGFIAGPVAGMLATRFRRRRLMIGSDLLSASAVTLILLGPTSAQPTLLYLAGLTLGATQTQWLVAMRSSVPDLVGADGRTRANAQLVTARSVAMLLGFASAGLIVGQFGFTTVFVIDIASYLTCALLLLGVPIGWTTGARSAAGAPAPAPAPAGQRSLRWSGAVLRSVPAVLIAMVAIRTTSAFGSGSHNVALPIYSIGINPDNPASFVAYFSTAWALGTLAAGRWLARRTRQPPARMEVAFAIASLLAAGFFTLAFTGLPIPLLVVVAAGAGAADGYAEISYTTRLQGIDETHRARLFGFVSAAQNAGFGLGMVTGSALLDRLALITVVAGAHGVAMIVAIWFVIVHRQPVRADPARDQTSAGRDAGAVTVTPPATRMPQSTE